MHSIISQPTFLNVGVKVCSHTININKEECQVRRHEYTNDTIIVQIPLSFAYLSKQTFYGRRQYRN